ncbi:LPS translocon maturation chaperone LptM [Methylotuvimicrobium buryatense]|uniref:Lipoprotein n=1 Tax=Methylotuvimicrobium buryatense TaxID=95641 RepID=A0A4V1IJY6_METBY|nr:lipoprotein [Methylotuvimicrobium buryatense]QCW83035.1 hypothetical protein EQU24_12900 [Methylotuvimicrobium buryatense]
MNYSKLLLAFFIALWITACGQTGPLYLPDGPAPIHVPKELPADIEPDEED